MILTALLRTVVPAAWGAFIAWVVGLLPILAPLQGELTGLSQVILPVVTALIIGAWYAFWRWLQPRLPDWAVRAVLGSAKTPSYAPASPGTPLLSSADEASRDKADGPDHRA